MRGGMVYKLDQGFETMDKVAEQLQNLLGKSKIKTAKIFHR